MMKRTRGLLLLLLLLTAGSTFAQRRRPPAPRRQPAPRPQPQLPARIARTDTTIRSTTLEVYQQYEPELKPVTKPELSPALPLPPATRTPQQYDVPQQTLYYSYRALPLRPLALGKDTARATPSNYALLGGGNYATILGEAGIGSLHGPGWQSAVQARYLSQEGGIEGQVYRSLQLKGNAALVRGDHLYEAGLDAYRNVYGRYGYNHDALHYSFDDVRMVYAGAALTFGMHNEQPGVWGIDYHPLVTASYFTGTTLSSERTIAVSLPVSKQIDSSLTAEFGLQGTFTTLDAVGKSGGNNIFQLRPGASFHRAHFYGHLGLYPTFGRLGNAYLLPDITAGWHIGDRSNVLATAGWQATLIQNTAQQLTTTNPFAPITTAAYEQTRSDDVFGGLSIGIGRHLSVWGRGGWQQYNALPLFITRPGGDGKDFDIIYDRQVQAITWSAGARYAIGEDFSLAASGAWYSYYKHAYSRVWGEPGVRLKGDASWRAMQGLLITAYAEVLDQIWAQDVLQQEVRLKGVFELGAAAEYTIIERLSLFLRAENLLGRRNERWLGYPSFGFNIYGGARLRF